MTAPARETITGSLEGETAYARKLTDAVILQAMEDLWNRRHKKESIEFFSGESLMWWTKMSGMSPVERLRLLGMIRRIWKGMRRGQALLPSKA